MPAHDEDGELSCELESVFALVDEIHRGLSNVQPCLSIDQLEQTHDVLFRRLLPDRFQTLALPDSSLQHAWRQLLARVDQHQHPSSWASFMTRVLCLLTTNKGQDSGQFLLHVWQLVAQPAEEKQEGLGRAILRACIDSIAGRGARELADGEPAGQLVSEDISSLMGCVIATLRRNGNPAAVSPPSNTRILVGGDNGGGAESGVLFSVCGLRLMCDVASYTLATLPCGELRTGGSKWPATQGGGTGRALEGALETWRWDFHVEVARLLRSCRVEEVRKHLVLTIARPLYTEWGNIGALEEMWAFIATADEESAELHLALLCILAEDLMRFLDLPNRHAEALWNLIYLGVSNKSGLCRRRGLHMLQRVIAWADESSLVADEESSTEPSSKPQAPPSPGPIGGALVPKEIFSREALLQWKEYARVMEVLEMETETHLLDQVVPTVERLCSELTPATSFADAAPMATDFRWIAIPLGVLISTGTVSRRRKLVYRIVKRDLGLGKLTDDGAGAGKGVGDHGLEHMEERWVAQVLLPALNHVGWHSSVAKGSLDDFSQSVTGFIRSYVHTLSVPRVANFLGLVLEAIRNRCIWSTDALCSILAAFEPARSGLRVPAMGPDMLFQLKEMLLVVLPPLNQAKRELLLDGVVQILETFTDFGQLVVSLSARHGRFLGCEKSLASLSLVMNVLSAIPVDLVKGRYLVQLAKWIATIPVQREGAASTDATGSDDATGSVDYSNQDTLRLEMYRGQIAAYIHGKTDTYAGDADRDRGGLAGDIAEGRSLCVLGLVLCEGFAHEEDREQMLANGIAPLVNALWSCWNNHYIGGRRVHTALVLFSAWSATVDVRDESERWRWAPLGVCVDSIVNLVGTRLGWLIERAGDAESLSRSGTDSRGVDGEDALVLLAALSEALKSTALTAHCSTLTRQPPAIHTTAVKLRDRCVSLLTARRELPLPPAAHLLAIASLEIVVRAQGLLQSQEDGLAQTTLPDRDQPCVVDGVLSSASAASVVLCLLRNKVEGRIASQSGSIGQGSDSDWGGVLKQHEVRKWSCISLLLPVAFGGQDGGDDQMGQDFSVSVCDAIVEGIRASSREELPMAMACFQTVFPCYLQALPQDERAAGFQRVFELVWGALKEVRRPQLSLARDLISGVLHPVALAMPELIDAQASSGKEQESCLVGAFSDILKFGAENKSNVLRALVGRLITLWQHSPGSVVNLVPGMVELMLFKDWGQGIETRNNEEASSDAETPRLMLLLFIENWLIPKAASGNGDSRQILRALTFGLMELQGCKAFRQSSITDRVVHGRKLRAWQALCVLCGYFCDTALAKVDDSVLEIVDAIATWFWPVHGRTALPPVRQQMEVFAVRMCKAYPDIFLGAVIKELADFRLPGQVLCSLLIASGHTLVGKNPVTSVLHRRSLFEACLPWMVGTHVMGRMIAQLVCYAVRSEPAKDKGTDGGQLEGLFLFLQDNPDMIKMRKRQLEVFRQTDCVAMCTVSGMLDAHGLKSDGEITPTHMCELLQQTMDEIWNEALQDKTRTLEEGRAWTQTSAAVLKGTWFEEHAEEPRDVDNHIQQKILPWDTLDLAVESASAASLQQSTAAGRIRQSVVMCATLVDKVPNLAGLARTCEIFAASSLVVPDARVLKNPAFSKISTGAEQWLPIEELEEKQLLAWIRNAKRRGYTLVGVEQTNNSVCLTKMEFPKRCVLMLGRENSGLPLEVINEMDFCVQIPQQGVLRSLNAHVSGALVLWEYTRQMLVASP